MAQEEKNQKGSNSSSGGGGGGSSSGRSDKKLKPKKIPQRGAGVAQLEKWRLEEQQKKDGVALQNHALLPPANSFVYMGNPPSLADRGTNFMPVQDASPHALHLPNPIPRPPGFILNGDGTHLGSGFMPNNAGAICARLWNAEYNHNREGQKVDYDGLANHSNGNFQYDTKTPVWQFPGMVQRPEHFQHPPTASMMNVASGNSMTSLLNTQIEPPSNQIYHVNDSTTLWKAQEEERMVGMKRPYTFAIEDAPGPTFDSRYHSAYASLIPRTNEVIGGSNGGISTTEPANTLIPREFPLSSNGMAEPKDKKMKEYGGSNGDFLTLAPPKAELQSSYSRRHYQEVPDFNALPYLGNSDETVKLPEFGQPVQQPFFNFLPPASAANDQSEGTGNNKNGEPAEAVDLNLKL